jgi:hypothetical protein
MKFRANIFDFLVLVGSKVDVKTVHLLPEMVGVGGGKVGQLVAKIGNESYGTYDTEWNRWYLEQIGVKIDA